MAKNKGRRRRHFLPRENIQGLMEVSALTTGLQEPMLEVRAPGNGTPPAPGHRRSSSPCPSTVRRSGRVCARGLLDDRCVASRPRTRVLVSRVINVDRARTLPLVSRGVGIVGVARASGGGGQVTLRLPPLLKHMRGVRGRVGGAAGRDRWAAAREGERERESERARATQLTARPQQPRCRVLGRGLRTRAAWTGTTPMAASPTAFVCGAARRLVAIDQTDGAASLARLRDWSGAAADGPAV
ncbi:hypothetical protein AAFF_G00141040 [Aldrovandia affinis]|uniref:Uncharacterized protein n=1 Tax=Aldrovandia affinis TaxID=143900 RepID=A0AAD7X2Z0_9TELE|nr:hypothetical protein AAFF_G00141040 [Aldrovandia affinis]